MWAEPDDVRVRWLGGEFPVTDEVAESLIADAEDTVLSVFPDLADRVDTEDGIPRARVVKVVARMVVRFLRNPEGIRQVSDVSGPFTVSQTYGGAEPGSLSLTDEDRRELQGRRVGAGRAFTIAPGGHEVALDPPDAWTPLGTVL